MTRAADMRDRSVVGCGEPVPEPTLWTDNGPLNRDNSTAEASPASVEMAVSCHLDRRA